MRMALTLMVLFLGSIVVRAETPSVRAESPRKVVIGTVMLNYYRPWPGLEKRLATLDSLVDVAAAAAERSTPRRTGSGHSSRGGGHLRYGKLAGNPLASPQGNRLDRMSAAARRLTTYLVAPVDLIEEDRKGIYANAAVLLDREGKVAGIYPQGASGGACRKERSGRRCHAGYEFPVFDCDFGRIGIQDMYDMAYPDGWQRLPERARK